MFDATGVCERAAQAGAVLAPIAGAELWRLSDDEVETALVALLRTEAALASARAGLLVEAEARSLRTRTQALSTARWLTQRMGVSRARGERLVRDADLVAAEPRLRDAVAVGHSSPEQAVVDGAPLDPAEACGLVEPATTDTRTGPQRQADALVALAQRAARAGQLPECAGQASTLLVTTTLQALEGRTAAAGLLPYGGRLDPASLRMLACDSAVIPAVLGGAGQLLDLGRTRRLFTPAQRRAIALRDHGCIHPGCPAPPIDCDTHHAIPWWAGGATDLDDGYLLCRHDHQRHHREGWTIGRDTHGNPYVIPPPTIDPRRNPDSTSATIPNDCGPEPSGATAHHPASTARMVAI